MLVVSEVPFFVISFWSLRPFRSFRFGGFVALLRVLVHAACTGTCWCSPEKTWAVAAQAPIPEVGRWQLKFCRGVHDESQAQSAIDIAK